MKQLTVDWSELELAFDNSFPEMSYYLDTETGRVLMVSDEIREQLESLYEEFFDPDSEENFDLPAVLQQQAITEWEQEQLLEADQMEAGYGDRYVVIPTVESRTAYEDMEDFISTVQDNGLQDYLWRAIQGRGAFRYFKDVLSDHPAERERWFAYRDGRLRQRICDWLADVGIEPMS
ncbi:MAG: UPF0158 family protein [Chloroflexota bacterium]